jgi:ParB/RepB/Spo0J family partition protein
MKTPISPTKLTTIAIDLKDIKFPEYQPRSFAKDETLKELCESMEAVGLINPITVIQHGKTYKLIAGHRRFSAARELGWKTIRATVFSPKATTMELVQLHENLIREQVRPTDEAKWLQTLMKTRHWTGRQLAEKLKRTESWVSDRLALLQLPASLTAKLDAGEIPFSAARELGRIKDPQKREALIQYAVTGGVDTATAAQWRADADAGLATPAGGPPATGANGRPVPVKMLCTCEVCGTPHDITASRSIKTCQDCYTLILHPETNKQQQPKTKP